MLVSVHQSTNVTHVQYELLICELINMFTGGSVPNKLRIIIILAYNKEKDGNSLESVHFKYRCCSYELVAISNHAT